MAIRAYQKIPTALQLILDWSMLPNMLLMAFYSIGEKPPHMEGMILSS